MLDVLARQGAEKVNKCLGWARIRLSSIRKAISRVLLLLRFLIEFKWIKAGEEWDEWEVIIIFYLIDFKCERPTWVSHCWPHRSRYPAERRFRVGIRRLKVHEVQFKDYRDFCYCALFTWGPRDLCRFRADALRAKRFLMCSETETWFTGTSGCSFEMSFYWINFHQSCGWGGFKLSKKFALIE